MVTKKEQFSHAFGMLYLWYMFGNMEKSWRPFEKLDYDLSQIMISYIANFVKTGNPNSTDLLDWKPM